MRPMLAAVTLAACAHAPPLPSAPPSAPTEAFIRARSHAVKDYVYVHPDDAVFVGQAAEQAAGDGPHGQMRYDSYELGEGRWDLVTMIYAGDDPKWIARVPKALAPGGLFVLEYFHDSDTVAPGDGSFARGELAKLFAAGFEIVRDEIVDDVPDWGNARTSLVRFVARKK